MQYNIADIARMFQVSEDTVSRWVDEDNLPAELIESQYRFERTELLEWAAMKKLRFAAEMFGEINGDAVGECRVADALARGGIAFGAPGGNLESALRSVVGGLPVPEPFDREALIQLFLARERLGTTAVGDGVAIPHPRVPVVLPIGEPVIHLAFLDGGIDLKAPDGKPVTVLFAMVCPTVHVHLQLLAKLSVVLQDPAIRRVLAERSSENAVLEAVRRAENSARHEELVGGRA
jgi:nitrogen PTS system EIIA component